MEYSIKGVIAFYIRLKIPNKDETLYMFSDASKIKFLAVRYCFWKEIINQNYPLASSKIPQIYTDCRGVLYLSRSKQYPVSSFNLSHFISNYSQSCIQILFLERNNQLEIVGANSKVFSYVDSLKAPYHKVSISLVLGLKHFKNYLLAS